MAKPTQIREGAIAKIPTQEGDVVTVPDSSIATAKLQDLAVTNSKQALMPTLTVKGNNTALSGIPLDLTIPQLAALFTAPTIQKFTSGSGIYTTPTNVKWIKVRMVGAGGGGGGSGTTTTGGTGTTGGNTSFGTSLVVANGGLGGNTYSVGGAGDGGGFTFNGSSTVLGFALNGGGGQGGNNINNSSTGGNGGSSAFGGAGRGATGGNPGMAGQSNTGGGGGGAASGGASTLSGGGGGSGAYVEAIIVAPSATYSYSVGASGAGGIAGTSGFAGGASATGFLIIEEFYQ